MSILIRPLVCARCEAILSFAERALVVKQKTHHDGRKHQCFTPQLESMLTEAECYCAELSMAIFVARCCDNCQNKSLADCAKTNKQQSSNTADRQQSINVHLCTPRHPNLSTGIVWHSPRTTRIDVLRRQTTHGHTRTSTRKPTGNGWSGGWSGQTEITRKSHMFYVFSEKEYLIPLDRGPFTLPTCHASVNGSFWENFLRFSA